VWHFLIELFWRALKKAVENAEDSTISILFTLLGPPVLGYFGTGLWKWWTSPGRSWISLQSTFKSSDPLLAGAKLVGVAIAAVYGFSLLQVLYADHLRMLGAEGKTCPVCAQPAKTAAPPASIQKEKPKSTVHMDIHQGGGSTANPGIIAAPVTPGECGIVQNGGSGNNATTNCNLDRELVSADGISISNRLRLMPKPREPVAFTYYYAAGDGDSYVKQIRQAIVVGNWPIMPSVAAMSATAVFDGNLRGVWIVSRDENDATATNMQTALKAGNIEAQILPRNDLPPDRSLQIWVGRK
jgi:hypothetical protein